MREKKTKLKPRPRQELAKQCLAVPYPTYLDKMSRLKQDRRLFTLLCLSTSKTGLCTVMDIATRLNVTHGIARNLLVDLEKHGDIERVPTRPIAYRIS